MVLTLWVKKKVESSRENRIYMFGIYGVYPFVDGFGRLRDNICGKLEDSW